MVWHQFHQPDDQSAFLRGLRQHAHLTQSNPFIYRRNQRCHQTPGRSRLVSLPTGSMSTAVLHHPSRCLCPVDYHHLHCLEFLDCCCPPPKTSSFANQYPTTSHCPLRYSHWTLSVSWIYLCFHLSQMWWLHALQLRLVSSDYLRGASFHLSYLFHLGKSRVRERERYVELRRRPTASVHRVSAFVAVEHIIIQADLILSY